jgi:hypothetical protein
VLGITITCQDNALIKPFEHANVNELHLANLSSQHNLNLENVSQYLVNMESVNTLQTPVIGYFTKSSFYSVITEDILRLATEGLPTTSQTVDMPIPSP